MPRSKAGNPRPRLPGPRGGHPGTRGPPGFGLFLPNCKQFWQVQAVLDSKQGEAEAQSAGEKSANHATDKGPPASEKPEHEDKKEDNEDKKAPSGGQKSPEEQAGDARAEDDEEVLTMEGGEEAD